ncbi:hypothetical protein [Zunongwangia sp. HRR-M8]|uniref:hypothetical protein n=1 Tax=Zunongwangia sp. HRR-M8 TaxID=3015170 RepID=UPI0022DE344B|nr:hypothetical protein [Zunongwangia sp. HRR-M8]WBL23814.1 hypothetical protein PBT89_07590 [Zunongwangia sp. HRR-M8]
MIEYEEIAREAISTIAPYLAVGGTEIIKDVSSDLWKSIKGVFKKKDEEKLLSEFEKNPTDISTKAKIEYVLESELKENKELADKISELTKSVQSTEEYKNYVSQVGDNNISIQGKISGSKINIKK